jgi:hypothetical protein
VINSRALRRSASVLAVHPLLGSPGALCGVSNGFLGVLPLKVLLSGSFEQVASMSLPLPTFD